MRHQFQTCTLSSPRRFICEVVALFALLLPANAAHARMGLLVGEPFGSFGTMMPQGHSSVYLSNICVETAIKLRPCRSGELGAVVSRYHDLRHPEMDWMAFPLPVFLYGTETPADPGTIPHFMTSAIEADLRERYREAHLADLVPDRPDRHGDLKPPPYGDWEEGIGSAFDRRLLMYEFDTTPAQDAAALDWLNGRENKRAYTLARANCADFAADLLRLVLPPEVVKRNVLADFDMTTPKTLAREVDHYGHAHPELHLHVYEIPQLPGRLRRSRPIRGAAESLLTNHYYLTTLLIIQPEIILADTVIYEKRGKFRIGDDAQTVSPADWQSPSTTLAKTTPPLSNTPNSNPTAPSTEMNPTPGSCLFGATCKIAVK